MPCLPIRRLLQRAPGPTTACCAAVVLLAAGPVLHPRSASWQAEAWRGSNPLPVATPAATTASERAYTLTPRRRALLNTIRYAEGTWKNGSREGYHTLYGGGRFASLAKHPEIVVVKRYTSAAAGAYQFLPGTWREASSQLQLASFAPANQDQAALFLVDRRGVLEQLDRQGLTREVMAVLAKEWASFPTHSGHSAYGQPVKQADELVRFFEANLSAQGAA